MDKNMIRDINNGFDCITTLELLLNEMRAEIEYQDNIIEGLRADNITLNDAIKNVNN